MTVLQTGVHLQIPTIMLHEILFIFACTCSNEQYCVIISNIYVQSCIAVLQAGVHLSIQKNKITCTIFVT